MSEDKCTCGPVCPFCREYRQAISLKLHESFEVMLRKDHEEQVKLAALKVELETLIERLKNKRPPKPPTEDTP